MEKIARQGLLYDFYGALLTEHQRQVYEDVVLYDLSLSEIAEEQGISRQGVHDLVKRCDRILEDYEEKLHLMEKFGNTKRLAREIQENFPERVTGICSGASKRYRAKSSTWRLIRKGRSGGH